jgi:hypothetical protein
VVARRGAQSAATLLWRGGASTDDAPEPDERRRRTIGPVVTMVARGAVGFGSSGGGSWRSAHDVGSSEACTRCHLLRGAHPKVASADVPLPRRCRPSLGSSNDDGLPYATSGGGSTALFYLILYTYLCQHQ